MEAVVLAMPGLLRGPTDLVAATDRRLIVVGSRRRVRSVAWTEVDGVESGARRTVIRTSDGDLVLGSIAPELGRRVIGERAGGRPGRAAGAFAVLAAVFGRSAWLHQDDLVRVEAAVRAVVAGRLVTGWRGRTVITLPDGRKIRTRRPHCEQAVRARLGRDRRFLAYAPDVAARLAVGRDPRPGS